MARWRLQSPHYLQVTWLPENEHGSEWEQVETDTATGRQIRKRFKVPMHLDPKEPRDWNYADKAGSGIIVVSHHRSEKFERDYIFEGEPTNEMEPLDEEAERISASCSHKWVHPIDTLPSNGADYSTSLIQFFEKELDKARRGQVSTSNIALPNNADATTLAEMQKRLEQLEGLLLEKQAKAVGAEPPMDLPPLEAIDAGGTAPPVFVNPLMPPKPERKAQVRRV